MNAVATKYFCKIKLIFILHEKDFNVIYCSIIGLQLQIE